MTRVSDGFAVFCGAARSAPYDLDAESHVAIGCFGGCACPVFPGGTLTGQFTLTPVESGGPFELYDVTGVEWLAVIGELEFRFTGDGLYRIGGALGLEQQLVLDLRINDGPLQHFDSGLVAGGYDFPAIDIGIPLHEFACWDTVLALSAGPVAVAVDAGAVSTPIRVSPNPFRDTIAISCVLRRSGPIGLRIHDVTGRLVRTVSADLWQPAGSHTFGWDGRSDGGAEVPAGVYFARLVDPQHQRVTVRQRPSAGEPLEGRSEQLSFAMFVLTGRSARIPRAYQGNRTTGRAASEQGLPLVASALAGPRTWLRCGPSDASAGVPCWVLRWQPGCRLSSPPAATTTTRHPPTVGPTSTPLAPTPRWMRRR